MHAMCVAASGLSSSDLVEALIGALAKDLGATACYHRWEEEEDELVLAAPHLDPAHPLARFAPGGELARALKAADGEPARVEVGGWSGVAGPVLIPAGSGAGTVDGVLGVYREGPDGWELALRTLGGVARSLATALFVVEHFEASEARFRRLVESVPHVVYEALAEDGELVYISPQVEELSGYAATDLLAGRPAWVDLVEPETSERIVEARRGLEPGAASALEYRVRTRDGELRWVEDRATARVAADGRTVLTGVVRDLGREKRAEAERLQRSSLASLGELAAGVAHEVNNPLSGVLNYAQLALRVAPDEPRLKQALEGILSEGRRIHETSQTLLAFARRPQEERFGPLSPSELARAVFTLMRRQLRDEFIQIQLDLAPDLPPMRAQGQKLQQILLNLLLNARHALNARYPERDPDKKLELRARLAEDGGHVVFEVRDRGEGIPPQDARRVFEPFFARGGGRIGLGLAISRDLAELHRGRLEVASEDGWTSFRLTVPIWAGEDA